MVNHIWKINLKAPKLKNKIKQIFDNAEIFCKQIAENEIFCKKEIIGTIKRRSQNRYEVTSISEVNGTTRNTENSLLKAVEKLVQHFNQ